MPSPRITYVGAGSAEFAARLITDVVATPGLDSGTFALVDIDAERLGLSRRIAERVVAASGDDTAGLNPFILHLDRVKPK